MKSASRMKQWLLLLLCIVMMTGVIVQTAGAAEFTKKCTNLINEGAEYFSQITVMGADVSKWRQNLVVYAARQDNPYVPVGSVVGMDIEVTDDNTRYSCTINFAGADTKTKMSCNSIPVNAIINGVYFIYQPGSMTPVDTPITFVVEQESFVLGEPDIPLHGTNATVQLPPFPCARNLITRNFQAAKDQALVLYTKEGCGTVLSCDNGSNPTCKTYEYVCEAPLVCEETGESGVCKSDKKCYPTKITENAPVDSGGTCDSPKICEDTGVSGACPADSTCISYKYTQENVPTSGVCTAPNICLATGIEGACPDTSKCLVPETVKEAVPTSGGKCVAPSVCMKTGKSGDCPVTSKCVTVEVDKSGTGKSPKITDSCEEYKCDSGELVEKQASISDQVLPFFEEYDYKNKYAIVNLMQGDHLRGDRVRVSASASPEVEFDYVMTLTFGYNYDATTDTYGSTADVIYTYDPNGIPKATVDASALEGLETKDLPLVLLGGNISQVNANGSLTADWGGNDPFPTSVNFDIAFWYENDTGTLGYENSVFHFIRNLNIKFASECSATAVSSGLYDPCGQTTQGFLTKLPEKLVIADDTTSTDSVKLYYGTTGEYITKQKPDGEDANKRINYSASDPVWATGTNKGKKKAFDFYFMTWKCMDAACDWLSSTTAYPGQLVISDGGSSSRTIGGAGASGGTTSMTHFRITPYYYKDDRSFAIKEIAFAAPEPGTYVIYTFVDYSTQRTKTVPDEGKYLSKIYVTVNETDELLTCYSRANNGYFKAWWNDCLSPSETQLIPFEHIPNTEEAWVINHSAYPVDYPFIAEYSYLPQKLEVASLNCKFEAISGGGRPGEGYCNHYNVHVPPYTKVTITGGTMYMSGYPEFDEYRAAYVREDLVSISHLIFSIGVEQCENKKIPDTGMSLRSPMSPLKVNEKVNGSADPATGFVFTGNSLRIPAIGLGMETPIPIVHVYYEDGGNNNMVWDLSTLGNYVGELEGGSYLPYGGNSVLTGHYWSGGVFKNLEGLNYEDEIIIFANDGFKYTYSVVQKFIAQPEDVYEMFQQIGDRSLTLVTCENYNLVTNEYERRYIVRAAIKNVEPYVENW